MLGIGTGSFGVTSASFVEVDDLITTEMSDFTVETLAQLPYLSSSFTGSLVTGSIWQYVDHEELTGSFTLLWNRGSLISDTGKFILTSSDGQEFSSSAVSVFDGDWLYIASGISAGKPFIELRTIDNDEIDFSASYAGTTDFSGVFTGSNYDFVMGANSGTIYNHETQGFYGEYRAWSRALSGSELDAHALHFESVGVRDPNEAPDPLVGHWALSENTASNVDGGISVITDFTNCLFA